MRLSACLGVPLHIIEPCGFPVGDKALKRVAMDYEAHAEVVRHTSWEVFLGARGKRRLVLLTTKASAPYTTFVFEKEDVLLLGRESSGVPEGVHQTVDARVLVPMAPSARSLNIGMAAAMVLGEGLRQTALFPSIT